MTIETMKKQKEELGWSNETLAKRSGVPFATVQKIFAGTTKRPRQKTLEALELALFPADQPGIRTSDPAKKAWSSNPPVSMVCEPASSYGAAKREATIEDIYALPDNVRAELMDGQLYYMAAPTRQHQEIVGELHLSIANHIRSRKGSCKVYIPPFGVFLMGDDSAYLEPDITVVCDRSKLDDRGCCGAPDWVIEVLSPSTQAKDMYKKTIKYSAAGVREYWIIHPQKEVVIVYRFDQPDERNAALYSFEEEIESLVIPDLKICMADLLLEV